MSVRDQHWFAASVLAVVLALAVASTFHEPAQAVVRAVAPGTLTNINASSIIAGGTKFTASGCANSATVGGATAGQFTSGTTGACAVTITLPTAPNGWTCYATDLTTTANFTQTASSTTSCGVTGTTTTSDVVHFMAIGY